MSSPPGQYLALVTKEEDSDWNVVFPDLPGCVTAGRSLDEAVAFAEEALALHVHGLREDGDAPPAPSDIGDVMADPESAGALFCLVPLNPSRAARRESTSPSTNTCWPRSTPPLGRSAPTGRSSWPPLLARRSTTGARRGPGRSSSPGRGWAIRCSGCVPHLRAATVAADPSVVSARTIVPVPADIDDSPAFRSRIASASAQVQELQYSGWRKNPDSPVRIQRE